MAGSAAQRVISQTPVAVIDFETTGLSRESDRVVEVSIVRIDPGSHPRLVLDTLVNPGRPVGATHIHGIRDADVRNAPFFDEILPGLQSAISGCVLAAYNAYFDMDFLRHEFNRVANWQASPYVCFMLLRPLLQMGSRCKLDVACRHHGIPTHNAHRASADATATAHLFEPLLDRMRQMGIVTYADLAATGSHLYLESLSYPLPVAWTSPTPCKILTREDAVTGLSASFRNIICASALDTKLANLTTPEQPARITPMQPTSSRPHKPSTARDSLTRTHVRTSAKQPRTDDSEGQARLSPAAERTNQTADDGARLGFVLLLLTLGAIAIAVLLFWPS